MTGSRRWPDAQVKTLTSFVQTIPMKSLTRKSLFALGVTLSVLLIAGVVLATSNNALTVTCVDESGKAIAGAKVQITALRDPKWVDAGNKPKWRDAKTDAQGIAKFDKLDDGAYRIVARPDGRAPGLYELAGLKDGVPENVTVTSTPGDPAKKFYFEDPALVQQAQQIFGQAMTLMQGGKFDEADQQLRASLAINPSSPDTLYYMAYTLIQEKKWDEALTTLQKDSKIVAALLYAPQQKDAKGGVVPSPFLGVQQGIQKMVAMLPSLKIKVQANDELNKKNFKQAISLYQDALKLSTEDPDTYYNLALAMAYDNQFDASQDAIDKAIALKKDDKEYLDLKQQLVQRAAVAKIRDVLTQADAAYNSKDYAGALKRYEDALPMLSDPKGQAGIWDQIGKTRTQLHQTDDAVSAYKRAMELDPQKPEYKQDLTRHYQITGQQLLTDKKYDQAFAAFAEGGISVFKLGQEWAQQDAQADLAIAAFQQVIKTEPQNTEVYYELGMVYWISKKDPKLAKENLAKYVGSGKDPAHLGQAKDIITIIDRKK
jgi:tetratricopeptide (TPR) repeat protein